MFPSVARLPSRGFDAVYTPRAAWLRSPTADMTRDLIARVVVGVLFALMSANLYADFMRTGHITGLLLLASESLVVVLTVMRRRAHLTAWRAEVIIPLRP